VRAFGYPKEKKKRKRAGGKDQINSKKQKQKNRQQSVRERGIDNAVVSSSVPEQKTPKKAHNVAVSDRYGAPVIVKEVCWLKIIRADV
jgi:hypothetical protein